MEPATWKAASDVATFTTRCGKHEGVDVVLLSNIPIYPDIFQDSGLVTRTEQQGRSPGCAILRTVTHK